MHLHGCFLEAAPQSYFLIPKYLQREELKPSGSVSWGGWRRCYVTGVAGSAPLVILHVKKDYPKFQNSTKDYGVQFQSDLSIVSQDFLGVI